MICPDKCSLDAVIHAPWRFDRIEVFGSRANGDPVNLSIPGEWLGQSPSGPNLFELAGHVRRILGPGAYGLRSVRRLGFWDSHPRLRLLYAMQCDRNRARAFRSTALVKISEISA